MIRMSVDAASKFVIESWLESPGLYLDNDSLIDLAKSPALADRVVAALQQGGTLVFSWVNAVDLAGPLGRSKTSAQAFLDRTGVRWVPVALNPWQVMRRELGREPYKYGHPIVSQSFVMGFFKERMSEPPVDIWDTDGLFRLGRSIDYVHDQRDKVLADLTALKQIAAGEVALMEQEYRKDASVLDARYPSVVYRPEHRVTFVLNQTMRAIMKESKAFKWMSNDGIDMLHAIMAVGSADIVALDKAWKQRMGPIAQQIPGVSLYYSKELSDLVAEFEARVSAVATQARAGQSQV